MGRIEIDRLDDKVIRGIETRKSRTGRGRRAWPPELVARDRGGCGSRRVHGPVGVDRRSSSGGDRARG